MEVDLELVATAKPGTALAERSFPWYGGGACPRHVRLTVIPEVRSCRAGLLRVVLGTWLLAQCYASSSGTNFVQLLST